MFFTEHGADPNRVERRRQTFVGEGQDVEKPAASGRSGGRPEVARRTLVEVVPFAQTDGTAVRSRPVSGESRIGGISEGVGAVGRLAGVSEPRVRDAKVTTAAPVARGEDQVELSTEAQMLSPWLDKMKQMPAVRQDLVDQIRAQIANGSYDTPEKLSEALDGMISEAETGRIC